MKSGFRNPKKWDERFYLTNDFKTGIDPIGKIFKSKSNRVLSGKTRRSNYSKAEQENGVRNFKIGKNIDLMKEMKWNTRFHVANSKNNMRVFKDYKEFFDRPIDYDVRGYNFTLRPGPMMVYEDAKGNPDIRRAKFDAKKKKELAKRISREKSKTTRNKMKESLTKNFNKIKIDEYGESNNNIFAGFLRDPKKAKQIKVFKKKENRWNQRFAIPISTYNEAVFKKYRLSFEEI
jgi:hypothetical protein